MAYNIADLFEHAVDAFPERVAVACGDRELTYAQLEDRANRLAHHLAQQGVGHAAHVGVYARNSIEAVITLLAIYKLRAVAVNINYRYVENELRYLFRDADLIALVHDGEFTDRVATVLPDVPAVRGVTVIDDEFDALLDMAPADRDFPARSSDDLYILYTGGTTGYPK